MYKIRYMKMDDNNIHEAVLDNLEDAQLWWDTIRYLRKIYHIMSERPS
jgi:hypothetical protein